MKWFKHLFKCVALSSSMKTVQLVALDWFLLFKSSINRVEGFVFPNFRHSKLFIQIACFEGITRAYYI